MQFKANAVRSGWVFTEKGKHQVCFSTIIHGCEDAAGHTVLQLLDSYSVVGKGKFSGAVYTQSPVRNDFLCLNHP